MNEEEISTCIDQPIPYVNSALVKIDLRRWKEEEREESRKTRTDAGGAEIKLGSREGHMV